MMETNCTEDVFTVYRLTISPSICKSVLTRNGLEHNCYDRDKSQTEVGKRENEESISSTTGMISWDPIQVDLWKSWSLLPHKAFIVVPILITGFCEQFLDFEVKH